MSPLTSVTVRHNFETGHRLPILGGKCENLHGHSWWVEVTATTNTRTDTVVEFGAFKKALREWIDNHLDHGLMLGRADPLTPILSSHGKVFVFGDEPPAEQLEWPTVENVAHLLASVAERCLAQTDHAPDTAISRVHVTETHVNAAEWQPGL